MSEKKETILNLSDTLSDVKGLVDGMSEILLAMMESPNPIEKAPAVLYSLTETISEKLGKSIELADNCR